MAANNPHMLMASLGKQHRMCVENGVKALSKWALKFGDRSDMDEDPILQLFSCEDHSLTPCFDPSPGMRTLWGIGSCTPTTSSAAQSTDDDNLRTRDGKIDGKRSAPFSGRIYRISRIIW